MSEPVTDHDVEYDRLSSGLDLQAALAFAQHRSTLLGQPAVKLVHLSAVGVLAAKYAAVYYRDEGFLEQRYHSRVCEAAGYLHEVGLLGCVFEDLVAVADEAVAKVVAGLTPDGRLPFPDRVQRYANQVGLGAAPVQLVKLADLRHDCKQQFELSQSRPADVRDWLEEAREVLACLHKLSGTPLASRIASVKAEVLALDRQTKDHRRRRGTLDVRNQRPS